MKSFLPYGFARSGTCGLKGGCSPSFNLGSLKKVDSRRALTSQYWHSFMIKSLMGGDIRRRCWTSRCFSNPCQLHLYIQHPITGQRNEHVVVA